MRIVFLGSPPFAEAAFSALLARASPPVGLVTAPPRRGGRGRSDELDNALAVRAGAAGIPVLRPERAADSVFLEAFAELRPELGVVVSYGQILRQELLDIPGWGCINLHASLLPRWRGASPIQAALLAGDAETGVCLQKVVRKLDAGPVLAERRLAIGAREDARSLQERLARAGAELLVEFLDQLGEGPLPPGVEQEEERATMCRRLRREDAVVDWDKPALEVDRLVRAMAAWPGAETALPDGSALKILAGEAVPGGALPPGTILSLEPRLAVACGAGAYAVARVQREGKAEMSAPEFLRGARLAVGTRLGESRR